MADSSYFLNWWRNEHRSSKRFEWAIMKADFKILRVAKWSNDALTEQKNQMKLYFDN
jgi:hypothetical protein